MFRSGNPYDNRRLTDDNIYNYILSSNLNYSDAVLKSIKQLAIKPFLQKIFRPGEGNCTLSSITTCLYYYSPQERSFNEIYDVVERIADNYYYKRDSFGVIPFFNKTIYQQAIDYFRLNKRIKSKYVNHIGFSFNTIKEQIDNKNPVILSLLNDGRNFYKNHTVVVIGYAQFNLFGHVSSIFDKQKIKNMLIVYDN